MKWILSRKPGKLCEDARRAHSPLAESGGALSDVTRFFGDLHLAATLRFARGASVRFLIHPIHNCIPAERKGIELWSLTEITQINSCLAVLLKASHSRGRWRANGVTVGAWYTYMTKTAL